MDSDRALTPRASILDNIFYALHEMQHLTERPAELKQEIFKLLFESAELSNFTADERAKYQLDMTTERDIHNQIVYARDKGLEEGLEKGREEGREVGLEEGREEGLARGREEGSREKALSTARSLRDLGVDLSVISQATGLSEEEIRTL